ncbi:hypothetical protein [Nonomuraea africana]|uniref:Uncharacterized protein n=1 Tax=Nonomuraea africana TaxID=46171 RepID=A0ABR9KI14_9ACTN|nr:hypothetical protein [Nonomuraea africana]MBE1561595.1 hypothetical protein [Nonomuraea africana]
MNDQLAHLHAQAVHRDRVAEAERLVAVAPTRAPFRQTLALRLHRLADSIDPAQRPRVRPSH